MFSTLPGSPPAGAGDGRTCTSPMPWSPGALDAPRQQVVGEDPLDGLFQPDVECDPDGVGVLTGAEKAARQRNDRLRIVTSRSPTSADTVLLLFITRPILIRWVTCRCRLVSVSLAPGWMNHRHTIAMISCPPPGHA
jgi:hypothetical protein